MEKRWTRMPTADKEKVALLADALKTDLFIAQMLVQRGINTFEEAKNYFRPEISIMPDPFLMTDMDKAIHRIEKAIASGEKILIYGDYDVDGTTAVALVFSFFKELLVSSKGNAAKDLIDFYIPDRYSEGYGISYQGIDFAKQHGFSLIIALDCGIKANEKISYANEKDIDFIICDHHTPGEQLPQAMAVLDPKRSDCSYPYKELSGCGIGFKLVQAFCMKNAIPAVRYEQFLDLVAISIASDIVPITGENRVLAHHGLKKIMENPRKGIKALLGAAQFKKNEITITDLVFVVGPRINAAGRIEHGKKAVELLISEDDSVAEIAGKSINEVNETRRDLDKGITEHALRMIAENPDRFHKNKKTTVLFHHEWHKGVIGIVASRIIERHYRPTILLTESNGLAVGSARSVRGFDIYEAIDSCSELLEQFGGHKYAAGLTLKLNNIEPFMEKFESVVAGKIREEMLIPEIVVDAELNFSDITPKFFRILKQFAPFGPENMKPVFVTQQVCDSGFSRIVGENHLKLDLIQTTGPRMRFPAIAFGMGEFYSAISSKQPFSICYTVEEKEWNGNVSLELNVKDIRVK